MKTYILTSLILFISLSSFAQEVGKSAPLFSGKTVSGDTVRLSDYKGKVTLIDFWASWCKPCKEEFPYLIELCKKYSDKDFSIIAVNVDNEIEKMKKFLDDVGADVPFKIIFDKSSQIPSQYNIESMPSVFVLDKNGVVRNIHIGFTSKDKEVYKTEIEKYLNEQ